MLKRNRALNPVVASIILIVVTVAVSVAVAVWLGALTFNFMKAPPANIKINPVFEERDFINVTIINNGPSGIYPQDLLINNATVYAPLGDPFFGFPVVVVTDLPAGNSHTSLINYNWTYNTVYTFTLGWWNSKSDGSADTSKKYIFSVGYSTPVETRELNQPIPAFDGADYAMWEWNYYPSSQSLQFRSDMTKLPVNMTIDVTMMNDMMLSIKIFYYKSTDNSMLFDYVGEKDFMVFVTKKGE
jgi:flagellin-like protein